MYWRPWSLSILTGLALASASFAEQPELPPHARARLGTMRFRHGAMVQGLAFSPDGKTLASLGTDFALRLWEYPSGRELRVLHLSPSWQIYDFRFSPDGKHVALATNSQTISAWEVDTGRLVRVAENLPLAVQALSYAPDGKTLAVAGHSTFVLLIDLANGKELRRLEWKSAPLGQGFAPLWRALCDRWNYLVGLADDPQGASPYLTAVAFSPGGKQVAAAGFNGLDSGTVLTWDAATGKELRRWTSPAESFRARARRLIFSARGKYLAVLVPEPNTVHIWDTTQAQETVAVIQAVQGTPLNGSFSPDEKTLAVTAANAPVQLLDPRSGQIVSRLGTEHQGLVAVAYARDGTTLVAAGRNHVLSLWDAANGRERPGPEGHQGSLLLTALSADARTLITLGRDHTVRVWDTAGRELQHFAVLESAGPRLYLNGAAFSSDGAWAAIGVVRSGPNDRQPARGTILVYEVATGRLRHTLALPRGRPGRLTFAPDGAILASSSHDGFVRLWDMVTGRALPSLKRSDAAEARSNLGLPSDTNLAFSSDSRLLWTRSLVLAPGQRGRLEGIWQIRVWECATDKERRSFAVPATPNRTQRFPVVGLGGLVLNDLLAEEKEARSTLVCAPDGQSYVLASDATLHLCDSRTGQEIRRFGGYGVEADTAAFSRDGKLLAAGTLDGTIYLWDVATGTVRGRASGHRGAVTTLTFSADGKTLVSGGADTTALVWDVASLLEDHRSKAAALNATRLQALWNELGSADAALADHALLQLAASPTETVAFLKTQLRPLTASDGQQSIAQLLADLDSRQFAVRERAMRTLEKLDRLAEPALRKALSDRQPSLEVRRRLERVLEKLQGPVTGSDQLQQLRAVELLEQLATPAARQLLHDLATGAADAWLTREARAALGRLQPAGGERR